MKTITLTQPYASLIAIGAKKIETRSRKTSYRGRLAIHAGKGPGSLGWMQMYHLCQHVEPFKSVLNLSGHPADALPLGAIIATCELIDCQPIVDGQTSFGCHTNDHDYWYELTDQERAFGDYTPGRYAWIIADLRTLYIPIPAKGAQGLWNWQQPEGWKL